MFWFYVTAVLGTLLIFALSFVRLGWPARLAIAGFATAVAVVLTSPAVPTLAPGSSWLDSTPYRQLTLFFLMLFGMGARVLSVAIEQRNKTKKNETSAALAVDRWDFVYPLLFAVPTFGLLQSQIQAETLSWQDAVLAFQNGFFWQTVLKRQDAK